MPHTFGFQDAAAIAVAPFIEQERRVEEAHRAHHHRSSLEAHTPFQRRSEAEIAADATAKAERLDAWRVSPQGRFFAALRRIEKAAETEEARGGRAAHREAILTARAVYDQHISHGGTDPARIGSVVKGLSAINSDDARAAVAALADLLIGELPEAA